MSNDLLEKKPVATLRWMRAEDIPRLAHLDLHSGAEDVWEQRHFGMFLKRARRNILVAEFRGILLGYVAIITCKEENAIISLGIAKNFQRKGVGTWLLAALATPKFNRYRPRIVLKVRESNLVAQLFLRSCNFRCIRIVAGDYNTPPEDAYEFEWKKVEKDNHRGDEEDLSTVSTG